MPITSRLPIACAAGAALIAALGAAPAAHGESVIFLQDNNVVAASVDGATKRSLTTNGTAESSYRSPSADDSGRWLAAREGTWYWHAADGKLLSADLVDKGKCESLNTGPTAGRLDPTGDFVAFESLCSSFAGQDITSRVVINFPGRPTLGNAPVLEGYRQPTWMGQRLVLDGGNGTFIQEDTPEAPVSTAIGGWLSGTTERTEFSRDRRRALISVKAHDDNPRELWLARLDADPPRGLPTAACKLPIQGEATRAGFSSDASRLVWHDDRGVIVSPTYTPPPSGTDRVEPCTEQGAPGAPVVISATGREPSFTPADLHTAGAPGNGPNAPGGTAPPSGSGPGGPGGPQPGDPKPKSDDPAGPSAGRVELKLAKSPRLGALRRGVALRITPPAAGSGRAAITVSARTARALGLRGSRTLASKRFVARAAGALTVRLRVKRSVAARLARRRSVPVTFAVSFNPADAPAQKTRLSRTLK